MDYYKCENCGKVFDEFEMNFKAAQKDKKTLCRKCREKETMRKYDKRLARGRRWFEYHCEESETSCDAKLWRHTHQKVEVLYKEDDVDEGDVGRIYMVRFADGYEYDVFDDELVKNPTDFYRPDYIAS